MGEGGKGRLVEQLCGKSVLFAQFFCKSKPSLNNPLIKKNHKKIVEKGKWGGGKQKGFSVLEEIGEGREGVLWVNRTDTKSGVRIAKIKPPTTRDLGKFPRSVLRLEFGVLICVASVQNIGVFS